MLGCTHRAAMLSMALALGCGAAAQPAGGPVTRGVSARQLTEFAFADDMPKLVGQQMRMRRIEIAPGGSIAMHSHRGRPALIHVLDGSIVERRGEDVREYRAGESYSIGGDVSHAIDNAGALPATYLEVDIVDIPPAR